MIKIQLKKVILLSFLLFLLPFLRKGLSGELFSQQLPYYSQWINNTYLLNPAITGTTRTIDIRTDDRAQWVGYNGAPTTSTFTLNSRFWQGKMGAGLSVIQDDIGPSQQTSVGSSCAYHIRFPDVEFSAGIAGSLSKYTVNGSDITIHDAQDPSINQNINNGNWVPDASAGVYLYNDRWQIGLSTLHLLQSTATLYSPFADTAKKALIKYAATTNFLVGYNFSTYPDFVIQNMIFASYVVGAPLTLDYTVRVHYKKKVFIGTAIRLGDAVSFQMGATFLQHFLFSYSYDLLISNIRSYSSGSQEIMLMYTHDLSYKRNKFLKQKYGYMF